MTEWTLLRYVDASGREILTDWLKELNDLSARARLEIRLLRLQAGNFGDCRSLRGGVSELRIDWGPGYRVYYSQIGKKVILLLCGGNKRKQNADIERAIVYLEDYSRRTT